MSDGREERAGDDEPRRPERQAPHRDERERSPASRASETGPASETRPAETSRGRAPTPPGETASGARTRRNGDPPSEFDERVRLAVRAIREGDPGVDPELLLEYTTDRRDVHPSVQIQWGIWTALGVTVLTVVLTNVLAFVGLPFEIGGAVFVGLFVLGMIWVALRYRAWVYQIQGNSLYLERGVVTHRRTHVPYVRIQHVDTSRGPLERWLGLSTLVVYTAGSRGADVSIPGLLPEESRDLQQRVKQLAIEAEGDDAL